MDKNSKVYKHICEYNKLEIDFSLFTLNESNVNYLCIYIVVFILQILYPKLHLQYYYKKYHIHSIYIHVPVPLNKFSVAYACSNH